MTFEDHRGSRFRSLTVQLPGQNGFTADRRPDGFRQAAFAKVAQQVVERARSGSLSTEDLTPQAIVSRGKSFSMIPSPRIPHTTKDTGRGATFEGAPAYCDEAPPSAPASLPPLPPPGARGRRLTWGEMSQQALHAKYRIQASPQPKQVPAPVQMQQSVQRMSRRATWSDDAAQAAIAAHHRSASKESDGRPPPLDLPVSEEDEAEAAAAAFAMRFAQSRPSANRVAPSPGRSVQWFPLKEEDEDEDRAPSNLSDLRLEPALDDTWNTDGPSSRGRSRAANDWSARPPYGATQQLPGTAPRGASPAGRPAQQSHADQMQQGIRQRRQTMPDARSVAEYMTQAQWSKVASMRSDLATAGRTGMQPPGLSPAASEWNRYLAVKTVAEQHVRGNTPDSTSRDPESVSSPTCWSVPPSPRSDPSKRSLDQVRTDIRRILHGPGLHAAVITVRATKRMSEPADRDGARSSVTGRPDESAASASSSSSGSVVSTLPSSVNTSTSGSPNQPMTGADAAPLAGLGKLDLSNLGPQAEQLASPPAAAWSRHGFGVRAEAPAGPPRPPVLLQALQQVAAASTDSKKAAGGQVVTVTENGGTLRISIKGSAGPSAAAAHQTSLPPRGPVQSSAAPRSSSSALLPSSSASASRSTSSSLPLSSSSSRSGSLATTDSSTTRRSSTSTCSSGASSRCNSADDAEPCHITDAAAATSAPARTRRCSKCRAKAAVASAAAVAQTVPEPGPELFREEMWTKYRAGTVDRTASYPLSATASPKGQHRAECTMPGPSSAGVPSALARVEDAAAPHKVAAASKTRVESNRWAAVAAVDDDDEVAAAFATTRGSPQTGAAPKAQPQECAPTSSGRSTPPSALRSKGLTMSVVSAPPQEARSPNILVTQVPSSASVVQPRHVEAWVRTDQEHGPAAVTTRVVPFDQWAHSNRDRVQLSPTTPGMMSPLRTPPRTPKMSRSPRDPVLQKYWSEVVVEEEDERRSPEHTPATPPHSVPPLPLSLTAASAAAARPEETRRLTVVPAVILPAMNQNGGASTFREGSSTARDSRRLTSRTAGFLTARDAGSVASGALTARESGGVTRRSGALGVSESRPAATAAGDFHQGDAGSKVDSLSSTADARASNLAVSSFADTCCADTGLPPVDGVLSLTRASAAGMEAGPSLAEEAARQPERAESGVAARPSIEKETALVQMEVASPQLAHSDSCPERRITALESDILASNLLSRLSSRDESRRTGSMVLRSLRGTSSLDESRPLQADLTGSTEPLHASSRAAAARSLGPEEHDTWHKRTAANVTRLGLGLNLAALNNAEPDRLRVPASWPAERQASNRSLRIPSSRDHRDPLMPSHRDAQPSSRDRLPSARTDRERMPSARIDRDRLPSARAGLTDDRPLINIPRSSLVRSQEGGGGWCTYTAGDDNSPAVPAGYRTVPVSAEEVTAVRSSGPSPARTRSITMSVHGPRQRTSRCDIGSEAGSDVSGGRHARRLIVRGSGNSIVARNGSQFVPPRSGMQSRAVVDIGRRKGRRALPLPKSASPTLFSKALGIFRRPKDGAEAAGAKRKTHAHADTHTKLGADPHNEDSKKIRQRMAAELVGRPTTRSFRRPSMMDL